MRASAGDKSERACQSKAAAATTTAIGKHEINLLPLLTRPTKLARRLQELVGHLLNHAASERARLSCPFGRPIRLGQPIWSPFTPALTFATSPPLPLPLLRLHLEWAQWRAMQRRRRRKPTASAIVLAAGAFIAGADDCVNNGRAAIAPVPSRVLRAERVSHSRLAS